MKYASFVVAAAILIPFSASAAAQTSITIEQVSPTEMGAWTVLYGNGTSVSSSNPGVNAVKHSFTVTDFAPMTLSITLPAGMTAKISEYRNGDLVKTDTTTQFSFTPYPNETYRFVVQYSYALMGSLGVTSNPSGLKFRMKGPTPKTYTATTPYTFSSLPQGKYTLIFASTRTCTQPSPHTAVVSADSRNTANISLQCNAKKLDSSGTVTRVSKRSIIDAARARELKARGQRK